MSLSDAKARNAKPQARPYKISDGEGLFLLVATTGSKYWRLKYFYAGKEKLLALGVYPEVGLGDARERRAQAQKTLAAGKDPGEVKKEIKRLTIRNYSPDLRGGHPKNFAGWKSWKGFRRCKRTSQTAFRGRSVPRYSRCQSQIFPVRLKKMSATSRQTAVATATAVTRWNTMRI